MELSFINHRTIYSILFYVLIIVLFIISKPPFVFTNDGQIKTFGIGQHKSIFSLGVWSVVLAFISYYVFAIIDLLFMHK